MQLLSLQLQPHQTWRTWPQTISLLQFLNDGSGPALLDLTIASMMTDVRRQLTDVANSIDDQHAGLKQSMANLRSALRTYNDSTVIDNTFVTYANYYLISNKVDKVKLIKYN